MEALVTSFAAAALAAFGGRAGTVRGLAALCGFALACLLVFLPAAFAGHFVHPLVTQRALSLLVALALAYAGVVALLVPTPEANGGDGRSTFLASARASFSREAGGRAQYIGFALAARYDAPLLSGLAAAAGTIAAVAVIAMIEDGLNSPFPKRAVRLVGAAVFLLAALFVAFSAIGPA